MDSYSWELRDEDREIVERELKSFLPDRTFDAHAHLHELSHYGQPGDEFAASHMKCLGNAPDPLDLAAYREHMKWLAPDSRANGLFIPTALMGEPETINSFVAAEVAGEPDCFAEMAIRPDMDPEYVREQVRRHKFAGLKPYHVHAAAKPTWEADIESYLPEPLVRIAHEERLCITLHMVKLRAIADPGNQQTIRRYCETYPNIKLILAHAARGFNPHHTVEGIGALRGLPNVWCDTAAVTDCGAFEAIVRTLGHERLLFGTDFFISHLRGRCVAVADSFVWLYEDTVDWSSSAYADVRPTLIGIESLRCLKLAAINLGLSDSQIEDVFYNNARNLFN